MVRKHFLLSNDQIRFLQHLPGTTTEHVRRALDDYIEKVKREQTQVSNSPSKDIKKGGYNEKISKPAPSC